MKKIYDVPHAELLKLTAADVIALSAVGTLGVNDWDGGIDVSALDAAQ